MKKKKKNPKKKLLPKKERPNFFKNSLFIFLNVTIFFVAVFSIIIFSLYKKADLPKNLEIADFNQTSIIFDRSGENILYEIHGEENRKIISAEKIPDLIRHATIASEDKNFYSHNGFDLKAILRAAKKNFKDKNISEGGSTITQQLARNIFLSREKTIKRKILEIILAIKIEKTYSKAEILNMYLNLVPYGSNAYGVQAAAQTFFKKNAWELSLDEAALLAALPKAPTFLSPYTGNTNVLVSQQQNILTELAEIGFCEEKEVEEAKKIITLSKISSRESNISSPHFVFYVRAILEKKYGKEFLKKEGLKIKTTLDFEMQKKAEKITKEGAKKNLAYKAENVALISLDPKTGQILAMVGSRDYFDTEIDGKVNVTNQARQPGSSFKPFIYARAFEAGYEPETMLADVPTDFGSDGSGKNYIPQNYDGKFHGMVSMRQALSMSLNIPAVKTLQLVGVESTVSLAKEMGFSTLDKNDSYGLALALGGGAVTLLEETSGFGIFANDGIKNPPEAILEIENARGEKIYQSKTDAIQVLDKEIARKINSILADNGARSEIFGTNSVLNIPRKIVAVKTGTSQDFRDGWTLGYTPEISVGVWVGNNDNSPMREGSAGLYVAAPIWRAFMNEIIDEYSSLDDNFITYSKKDAEKEKLIVDKYTVNYYDKKTGKKLSEKRRSRIDPGRVETRYEMQEDIF